MRPLPVLRRLATVGAVLLVLPAAGPVQTAPSAPPKTVAVLYFDNNTGSANLGPVMLRAPEHETTLGEPAMPAPPGSFGPVEFVQPIVSAPARSRRSR